MTSESDHKHFAIQSYSLCWELLVRERTDEENRNLVGAALTSRYHWRHVGGKQEKAIADWMASRAFAMIGEANLAKVFAEASMLYDDGSFPAWLKASLLEGLARAHHVSGEFERRDLYVSQALAELERERDAEDVELIRQQLSDLT
jgi:hypothetical protein